MQVNLSPSTAEPARRGFLRRRSTRLLAIAAMALALSGGAIGLAGPASADEIGQAPTATNIRGNGSFAVTQQSISSTGSGSAFGGGIVYYPTTAGRYPVIALCPGFTARWSSISWLGPRLASWGFVVVGINTTNTNIQPTQRGTQLRAALSWSVNSAPSAVTSRADGTRRGVGGHSMGGGGTLAAMSADPGILAGVPLAPWNTDKTWGEINRPVSIVGGQNDTVAPVGSHSIPFYNSLSGPKAYIEVSGGSHFFPNSTNGVTSQAIVSHFKRYLNGDTRFTPFICSNRTGVSNFRSSGIGC